MVLVLTPWALFAEITPASLFTDHMVLQREMPVPVWGQAEAGETIAVTFADQRTSAKADENGKWKVILSPLKASAEGRDLTIQDSTSTLVIKDVLVGEVWICSGQSNMQYGWGKSSHPMFNWGGDQEIAVLAQQVSDKPIRCFEVMTDASFEEKDFCMGSWKIGAAGSAVAFGFSYMLQEALNVPVAVIVTCWGSSSIEGWMPLDMTEQLPHFKEMMTRFDGEDSPARKRVDDAIKMGIRHGMVFVRKQPNLLYNAMMHPLIPYAARGMVWYQGEANDNSPDLYEQSFSPWLRRLRQEWGRKDFVLLAVMLPGFGQDDGRPDATSWAPFREAQMSILKEPHTAVANTIDLGDAKNIHPSDKAPICKRLSLLARKHVYGEDILAEGPRFRQIKKDGHSAIISFDQAADLQTNDGQAPRGFWLSDEDGTWHPAIAEIKGETVVLHAEGVTNPVHCRYAWCGKPDVNLVNMADLPTYPFRTDKD
jgi:sialate O-acetylesterase